MKGIVAMAVAGPFLLPAFDRLLHVVAVPDQRKIDDRRRAAMQRGLADPCRPLGHLVLGRARYDDRPAAMDMRVDAAGNDDLSRCVDGAAGADRPKTARGADCSDLA